MEAAEHVVSIRHGAACVEGKTGGTSEGVGVVRRVIGVDDGQLNLITIPRKGVGGISRGWNPGCISAWLASYPYGVMYCGLWRYKWESWVPRPVYFYYAALTEAFRPGCALHRISGLPDTVSGLAARSAGGELTVALLNHGATPVEMALPVPTPASRLRVAPDRLPRQPDIITHETGGEDVPLADWTPHQGKSLRLASQELTLVRSRRSEEPATSAVGHGAMA